MARDDKESIMMIKRIRENCGSDRDTFYTILNLMREAGINKPMLDAICTSFNRGEG